MHTTHFGLQVGPFRNYMDRINGVQLGLNNRMFDSNGLQFSSKNLMANNSNGLQIGIENVSDETSNVFQLGLWNTYLTDKGERKSSPLFGGSTPAFLTGWGATIGAGVAVADKIANNGQGLETILSSISNLF